MVSWTDRRRKIIEDLLRGIRTSAENGIKCNREFIISNLAMTHSTCRRTAIEYLKTLSSAGHIIIDGEDVFPTGADL